MATIIVTEQNGLKKMRTSSSKNGEMHPISGEENLQTDLTVGIHAANSGFDYYHAQKWSGGSFSSNRKRIIIDNVSCSTGFFKLSKEIESTKKYFVVCFCFRE